MKEASDAPEVVNVLHNTAKAENEKIALREKAISEVIKPCEVNCTCETCGKFRYVWESGWNAAIEHSRQENARLREALEHYADPQIWRFIDDPDEADNVLCIYDGEFENVNHTSGQVV